MKWLLLLSMILSACVVAQSQEADTPSPVVSPAITMVEGMINVDMQLNLTEIPVKSSEVVIID